MRSEEITADHIEIAIVNMAMIFRDQPITVHPIPCRNIIPSKRWLGVVGRVKVVVKKERSQEGCIFDNRRAFMNIVRSEEHTSELQSH